MTFYYNVAMANTKKTNTKTSAKTTKTNQTQKKTSDRKNQKKHGKWEKVLLVIVLALLAVWYLTGRPALTISDSGVFITLREEPLINRLTGKEILPYAKPEEIVFEDKSYEPSSEASFSNTKEDAAAAEVNAGKDGNAAAAEEKASKKDKSEYSSQADLNYPEDDPLHFGNPSDALNDLSKNKNYLMIKPQYSLSYNTETLCPNWVAWHLDADDIGDADRSDDFRPDPDLPAEWYAVKKADYQYNAYGYDRGHVCPSADRTATKEDNSMTFLMTNMVPQSPDNNRVIWMHFENYERELVKEGNELYIIAGPLGSGGRGAKGSFTEIPVKTKSGEVYSMNVPAFTWKVLIAIPQGQADMDRITKDTKVIAINVPNQMGMGKTGDWEQYITTIDYIEQETGYDFFELLPDEIEDILEAKTYSYSK